MANPVYVISGATNVDVRATVHLPNTLDPDLRVCGSKFAWKTEKMAKRDAAFQAYKSLYESGLVTDNLIPPNIPKEDTFQELENRKIETRDSVYSIAPQYDPWPEVMKLLATTTSLYSHEIQTTSADKNFPTMSLLLPMKLDQCSFSLYESSSERISVSIASGVEIPRSSLQISRKISFYLLSTILGRRLRGAEGDQIPLVLIPSVSPEMLQCWYDQYSGSNPLVDCISNGDLSPQAVLLKVANRNVPYVFRPHASEGATTNADGMTIRATRLSRKLDYLSLQDVSQQITVTAQDSFVAADCQVLDLPAEYGHFMLLVPAMTHMFEVFLRSTEACKGPMSGLAFQSTNLVSEALTLPVVSTENYQRLEFLGDELLKYYASIQVFTDYPKHPEGLLTVYTNRIVANSRLQRATRSLGLDRFLTRVKFSGQDWSAGLRPEAGRHDAKGANPYLSSKILADVIEALIGAAYVDGAAQDESEEKAIAAMKLFIDEINWRTPAENFAKLEGKSSGFVAEEKLEPVEGMIGYRFKQPHLLAEALTHSSYNPGISSYDRLEFLGDAVLDHIVKVRLYQNNESLSPAEMTLRRHALVSHATLSFFALQASHISTTTNIEVDLATKKTTETGLNRTIYLPDHIRLIDSREMCQSRKKTLSTYKEVQPGILHAFEHGKTFPWAKLLSLDAPKSFSDVIESILGAVFVDSGASLEACERVLEKLGYLKLVTRVTSARKGEVSTIHPEEELHDMARNAQLVPQRTANSGWRCKVMVDDERVAHATRSTCKEQARCKAAERAVRFLNSNKKRKLEALESSNGDGDAEMALESSVLG
jgi:dsRNA-specific ribonuclease